LAENIKDESQALPGYEVPAPEASDVDVTEDATTDEFIVMELDDDMPATTVISASDNDEEEINA
jgi:hypothetical protein